MHETGNKKKASRPFMSDSLWGWTTGQLSADELFNLKVFVILSGCISPAGLLSSQGFWLKCWVREVKGERTSATSASLATEAHVNKNIAQGTQPDSASRDFCHVLMWITAAPDIWQRSRESSPAPPRWAGEGWGEGWGGARTEMRMNKSVMLDLDEFQKSTPYALVSEWIIQRYAGSRLICH